MHVLFDPNTVRINQIQKGVRVVRVPYGGGRHRRFNIPLEVETVVVPGDRPVADPTEDRVKKKRKSSGGRKRIASGRKKSTAAATVIVKPSIDESRSIGDSAPLKTKTRAKKDIFAGYATAQAR